MSCLKSVRSLFPLVLLLYTIHYFGTRVSNNANLRTQRDLLEFESQIIVQTVEASVKKDTTKPALPRVVIDLNSNAIYDKNTNIKIAVGQYPKSKPYKLTAEIPQN